MVKRYAQDGNEADIVKGLRGVGASVLDLGNVGGGCPDILVGFRNRDFLMEIKDVKGKVSPVQTVWHSRWRGRPVAIVRSLDEALIAIGAID